MDGTDHLSEDPVLSNQKYVCLSILTANSIRDSSGNSLESSNHAKGVKIRGVYETLEEAQKRCEQIRAFDSYFNVFIGQVGKWLPWDDDAEKAEEAVYAEKKLNEIMKGYKEQQKKAQEYNEYRKQQDIERALKLAQEREKEKKKVDMPALESVPGGEQNIVQEGLVDYKQEIVDKEKRLEEINKELESARRLFEEMKAKNNNV
jgi:hypothetical protein